jgi:hypothetical protein
MRRVERSIPSRVKSLAASECANHQNSGPSGIKNYCWLKERSNGGVCVFFSDVENPRCRYFQEAVLPLDKELKAVFSSEVLNLQIQEGQRKMIRKKCERCPETFLARSNAQMLCPGCQSRNAAQKNRERQARFQKNHKNGLGLTESSLPIS